MKIIVTESYEEMSKKTADIIEEELLANDNIVLGLATGSTPIGTYNELIRRHSEGILDFSNAKSFNLDEYLGLSAEDVNSYNYFMKDKLFEHINLPNENAHVPDGLTDDPENYGDSYDKLIKESGGIDLQILGIGANGHIAFNEPAEELRYTTGPVILTEQTIEDNSRFFESKDLVPTSAVTMGMGSIMKAKRILLLANGLGKADAIAQLLNSKKITTFLPASLLLLHSDATLICDREAFSQVNIEDMAGELV
ncbi:MAG: glucosamine-6-phosphate deaminase [Gudongella sp.]|jgi:glucosamine-6-phosphate deaminase|nr:glucosamine-6-phosphate deaminase [Gudongella sp.]